MATCTNEAFVSPVSQITPWETNEVAMTTTFMIRNVLLFEMGYCLFNPTFQYFNYINLLKARIKINKLIESTHGTFINTPISKLLFKFSSSIST